MAGHDLPVAPAKSRLSPVLMWVESASAEQRFKCDFSHPP
jgi:hypothetical protein